ncbi:MAG: CD1871A family CXXC motif-containing protein [Anaerovoracaceae bacterium]
MNKVKITSISILFIGAAAMFLGIYRQEVFVVFSRAVRVCLECIGIG